MKRGITKNEKLEIKQNAHIRNNGNCHCWNQPAVPNGKQNNEQPDETVRAQSNGNTAFGTGKSY